MNRSISPGPGSGGSRSFRDGRGLEQKLPIIFRQGGSERLTMPDKFEGFHPPSRTDAVENRGMQLHQLRKRRILMLRGWRQDGEDGGFLSASFHGDAVEFDQHEMFLQRFRRRGTEHDGDTVF